MRVDKERRRALYREAARKRRRVESDTFADLSSLLPLRASVRAHLDKPSVIRLAICYMRLQALLRGKTNVKIWCCVWELLSCFSPADEMDMWKFSVKEERKEVTEENDVYLRIMEGFVMVLSSEGNIMFLSENVSCYIGLTQTELMGHNVFEFMHPCDHEEIRSNLRLSADGFWSDTKRDFVVRIKSTLTLRGRSTNLKSATWKVVQCQGRVRACPGPFSSSCLLLTCRPLPVSHTCLCTRTFSSQHSMDMRFTHCDSRVLSILGYTPNELMGRSIYEFCHTLDTISLTKYHTNLCSKSQSVSGRYRMLVRGGGYVWVESHSAVVPGAKTPKYRTRPQPPLLILCVTYVLSGVEEPFLQLSLDQ
ncbi:endothelial PAS domain-containing protein 1-like [Corythoichthys intestinalis]|uniref:endothelial PAS domain-containing protein 1-like n=1 Tax=Corythoichthys intestinalis TaxID=161448 RepID=UPI0025A52064|nr:endothelial PAS domain-containing protein 1-like [Corythoichthys intestinalis]XP_061807741.1 endothelial PAS domain-containing protein 1-like [Nerophis lumbriciformis]